MKQFYFNSQADYNTVTIIRTITVILVAFQHSFGPYSKALNYINDIPIYTTMIFGIITTIFDKIYMPLLIFISGYLYQSLYKEKNKYKLYSKLIFTKIKRLIIPAYFFGIIFLFTLNPYNENPIQNITNGYLHLWYLPALFWCFIFAPLLSKIENKKLSIILLLISFIFIYIPLPNLLGINHFHVYFFYFILGITIAQYKNIFMNLFLKKKTIFIFFITWIILLVPIILYDKNGYTDQPLFNFPLHGAIIPIIRIVYKITTVITIFLSIEYLTQSNKIHIGKRFDFLDKTSYGVYIFHMWIMWLLFKNNHLSPFITQFATEHYLIFPILYFIFSTTTATILTALLQKNKIGKFLLG